MAANRFATLIHRKTNRITLVLVYAFLEWSLIFFILLNSLFSYFILRFADYFGLKRPCLFCSRLDRFFDASGKSPSHSDLLCDDHALEISSVLSKPSLGSKGSVEGRLSFDEFPRDLVAPSCCAPIEPDLGDIGYSHTTNLIGDDVQIHNGQLFIERFRSVFLLEEKEEEENVGSVHLIDSQERSFTRNEEETEEKVIEQRKEEEEEEEDNNDDDDEFACYVSSFDCNKEVIATEKEEENKVDLLAMEVQEAAEEEEDDKSALPNNLEFYIDDQDCHLIPVEEFYKPSEEVREISDVNGDFILDFGAEPDLAAVASEKEEGLFSEEISDFLSPDESKPDHSEAKQGALFEILTSYNPFNSF